MYYTVSLSTLALLLPLFSPAHAIPAAHGDRTVVVRTAAPEPTLAARAPVYSPPPIGPPGVGLPHLTPIFHYTMTPVSELPTFILTPIESVPIWTPTPIESAPVETQTPVNEDPKDDGEGDDGEGDEGDGGCAGDGSGEEEGGLRRRGLGKRLRKEC